MRATSEIESTISVKRNTRVTSIVVAFLIAATASVFISFACGLFTIDDALISYRYSDRLLHGHGLTWNNDEFVEGYSNLLWVLLVAASGLIDPDLVIAGRALGLAADVAVLAALTWAFAAETRITVWAIACGLLALSLSVPFSIWGTSGLETPLFESLLAWALATTYRTPQIRFGYWIPPLLLGLLSITRPDGLLFGIGFSVVLFVYRVPYGISTQRALLFVLVPALFVATQTAFRFEYYGQLVPNTAYAKLAFTANRVLMGAAYVGWGALVNCVPLGVVVILLVRLVRVGNWEPLPRVFLALTPATVWLGYVVIIGGDAFPWNRHWLPSLVCAAFSLVILLGDEFKQGLRRSSLALTLWACIHLAIQIASINTYFVSTSGKPQIWRFPFLNGSIRSETECLALGKALRGAFSKKQPLLAVNAAGCIPYSSSLPSVDMLGLNDFYLAHHRPESIGRGTIGHELGSGAYVLSRKPDIIQLGVGGPGGVAAAVYPGEREMVGMADFLRFYRPVNFRAGTATFPLWIRVEDGRVGIVRKENEIAIPGFLLATRPGIYAIVSGGRGLAAQADDNVVSIGDIYIPEGNWKVAVDADTSSEVKLRTSSHGWSLASPDNPAEITSKGDLRSFAVLAPHSLIYAITLHRLLD